MKKYKWIPMISIIILFIYFLIQLTFTDKKEISHEFAAQLYQYPLPPETEL